MLLLEKGSIPQSSLEIPCCYIFRTNGKLIATVLEIAVEPISGDIPTPWKHKHQTRQLILNINRDTCCDDTNAKNCINLQIYCYHSANPVSVVTIHKETNNKPPPKKRKLSDINIEGIMMGEELCNADINLSQTLLRAQFPELGGF